MSLSDLSPEVVAEAHRRISPHIHRTPVMESHLLNRWLGTRVLFKMEPLQKIGAFKIRGALNALLALKEAGTLPEHIVAFSSGNHAQAVAYAAKLLKVRATIFLPSFTSAIKQQATRGYGAEVILTPTRDEAEAGVKEYIAKGACFIHPYDNDHVIAGQGTATYEALQDAPAAPEAIFIPVGGGGLSSGTWLAGQLLAPGVPVFAAEPRTANDAADSLRTGAIVKLPATPQTIADGVTTLAISERTFGYLKKTAGIIEVEEESIIYWTQWLMHLLKVTVEPTSALAMAAAAGWLKAHAVAKTVLVILSAGNVSPDTYRAVWQTNYLDRIPRNKK